MRRYPSERDHESECLRQRATNAVISFDPVEVKRLLVVRNERRNRVPVSNANQDKQEYYMINPLKPVKERVPFACLWQILSSHNCAANSG